MAETKINQNQIEGGSGGGKILNVYPESTLGSFTRDGSKISGITRTNYIYPMQSKGYSSPINSPFNFGDMIKGADTFEIVILARYKAKTYQYFLGEKNTWASRLGFTGGKLSLILNFDGGQSSQSIFTDEVEVSLTEDTDYYFKFAFDGEKYTLDYKEKNAENYTTGCTINDSTKFSSGRDWVFGVCDVADGTDQSWNSYIDFEGCQAKADGEIVWKGVE